MPTFALRDPCGRGGLRGVTANISAAAPPTSSAVSSPRAGRHFTKATPNRSSPQFADYLLEIAASYPQADTIRTPNLGELALGFPRPKPVVKDFVPRTETENYRI
jgi:hypothetical protein